MKSGRAIMQYKWLLGYEKGPDGKPAIVPEQAEIVRFIYDRYLAGDTLQGIKETLEAQRHLTAAGNTTWTTVNIRSILTNEKYCGDVLLQKTFIQDCISKKVIPNTGQLPKYLIQNHHEGIISRETSMLSSWRWPGGAPSPAARKRALPPAEGNTAASMC